MKFIALYGIETVWGNIICIFAANLPRLLIHERSKLLYAAAHMLRNRHRRVIVGFQHQGERQISQSVLLAISDAQMHWRHGSGIRSHSHCILKLCILKRDNERHNLGSTRHGKLFITAALIQHPSGICIHQDSCLGIEPERRLLCCHINRLLEYDCNCQKNRCKDTPFMSRFSSHIL